MLLCTTPDLDPLIMDRKRCPALKFPRFGNWYSRPAELTPSFLLLQTEFAQCTGIRLIWAIFCLLDGA